MVSIVFTRLLYGKVDGYFLIVNEANNIVLLVIPACRNRSVPRLGKEGLGEILLPFLKSGSFVGWVDRFFATRKST